MSRTPYLIPLMASGGSRDRIDAWRGYRRARAAANADVDRLNLQYYSPDADYGVLSGIRRDSGYASAAQGFGGSGRIAQMKARPRMMRAGQEYMNNLQGIYGNLQNAIYGLNNTTATTAMRAVDSGVDKPAWSMIDPSTQEVKRIMRERYKL